MFHSFSVLYAQFPPCHLYSLALNEYTPEWKATKEQDCQVSFVRAGTNHLLLTT